jgi:inorganic pyrophosphatase
MANEGRLDRISPYDEEGDLRVVTETSQGSRNKYSYDPECRCLQLKKVLPEGMVFPYDFGFVPSTSAGDGDPLDVMVLMDFAVPPLCIITVRLIGVIEARQKEKGEDWVENNRLVAVAIHAKNHQTVKTLSDLRPHLLDEVKAFFKQYNALEGRKFKLVRDGAPAAAKRCVDEAIAALKKKNRKK